jgi:hypothetical protein
MAARPLKTGNDRVITCVVFHSTADALKRLHSSEPTARVLVALVIACCPLPLAAQWVATPTGSSGRSDGTVSEGRSFRNANGQWRVVGIGVA